MSFGSLSPQAIEALNAGAHRGGFAHNTGEGSVTPYHRIQGGDPRVHIGVRRVRPLGQDLPQHKVDGVVAGRAADHDVRVAISTQAVLVRATDQQIEALVAAQQVLTRLP